MTLPQDLRELGEAGATMAAQGTGNPGSLRRANEQRVLEALRLLGSASQATLARQTGLSPASINNITRDLVDRQRLHLTPSTDGRETRLSFAPPRGRYLTMEISYVSAQGALLDFDNNRRIDDFVGLEHESFEQDIDAIRTMAARMQQRADAVNPVVSQAIPVQRAIVGIRSAIDAVSGQMSPSVAFRGWQNIPVSQRLSAALELPLAMENDSILRTLAEGTWGIGRGVQDFLYLKTSPGISAGVMMQGRVLRGTNGMAGEVGHMVMDRNGPLCECGNRGCLHAMASARMLVAQARAVDGDIKSPADIIARARAGDGLCTRLLAEAGESIGLAIANVVALIGVSYFVIGGELPRAGELFMRPLRESVERHTLRRVGSPLEIREGLDWPDLCLMGGLCQALSLDGAYLSDLPDWASGTSPSVEGSR